MVTCTIAVTFSKLENLKSYSLYKFEVRKMYYKVLRRDMSTAVFIIIKNTTEAYPAKPVRVLVKTHDRCNPSY